MDTHSVSIRELMDERDRRYEERFIAQDRAMAAALAAQDKAITKAEASQNNVNASTNEFRGQLKDQAQTLMPRSEADTRFNSTNEKIEELKREVASLRESRSQMGGERHQPEANRSQANWIRDSNIGTLALIAAIAEAIILYLKK